MEIENTRDFNRFERFAQEIWGTPVFDDKKRLMLAVIDRFEFKSKSRKFVDHLNALKPNLAGCQRIDKMVADLVLIQSGDRAI